MIDEVVLDRPAGRSERMLPKPDLELLGVYSISCLRIDHLEPDRVGIFVLDDGEFPAVGQAQLVQGEGCSHCFGSRNTLGSLHSLVHAMIQKKPPCTSTRNPSLASFQLSANGGERGAK